MYVFGKPITIELNNILEKEDTSLANISKLQHTIHISVLW